MSVQDLASRVLMMTTASKVLLAAAGLAAALAAVCGAHAASLQPLGNTPGTTFPLGGIGISGDGSVVAAAGYNGIGPEAFRWTPGGGAVGLGPLTGGSDRTTPSAISADGTTIVGYGGEIGKEKAFRWTKATGAVDLGDFPGGPARSFGLGVSADGSVVVGSSENAFGPRAFRWTSSTGLVELDGLPGHPSGGRSDFAFATSADGSVIVGRTDTIRSEAFLWKMNDGAISLDPTRQYFQSSAQDVSADGSVVVGYRIGHSAPREAFRWTKEEGMIGLGGAGSGFELSDAFATSDDGSVIVGTGYTAQGWQAFIWTKTGGMQTLRSYLAKFGVDTTGLSMFAAYGVSADGRTIVADNFVASISAIPEPSTLGLVLGGLGLLAVRRRTDAGQIPESTPAPTSTAVPRSLPATRSPALATWPIDATGTSTMQASCPANGSYWSTEAKCETAGCVGARPPQKN